MDKSILIKIEQNLKRIADSLEKNNSKNLTSKLNNKSNAFIWEADNNLLRSVKKINVIELDLLQGIDHQVNTLYENTLNFSNGFHANNALLWGAKGGGKSSLIKSIFFDINKRNKNLKIIEINREDLETLPKLLNHIKEYNKQFIIYCDDLSFDKNDIKFKSLKSILEGGIEGKPSNVIFYATSNIRHIISNQMSENNISSAISPSDNLNETISLSDRFGLWIGFHNIDQKMYINIVEKYLKFYRIRNKNINFKDKALEWSKQRGSRSGRVAWQFVIDIAGKLGKKISN
tara:strand:- start:540 stop:1406 length:867 start_codon:yes stop_codon:yes gene_type:complete